MLAALYDRHEAIRLLIAGSDLTQQDRDAMNALKVPIHHQHWACADLLAFHSSDADFDRLQWPTDARQEDFPYWKAREEQRVLHSLNTSTPSPNPRPPRNKRL